jgi:hypothetical protein
MVYSCGYSRGHWLLHVDKDLSNKHSPSNKRLQDNAAEPRT